MEGRKNKKRRRNIKNKCTINSSIVNAGICRNILMNTYSSSKSMSL